MELGQYLNTIWKWIWLIVLAAAVAAVSSFYAVSQAPRVYQTKTTLMVGQFIRDPDPNTTDFWTSQQLAQTYVQLVGREPILQGSLDALNLSDQMDWRTVSGMVRASLVAGTQLMEIFVTDTNPERAKVLADTIAQQLILQSPANAASDEDDRRAFAAGQLIDLEGKIEGAEIELKELQTELDEAISARRIQDLQTQINTLQGKVSTWQSSYAQFLLFLEGGQVNYLTVVEPALVPTSPISPNVMMNILLAVGIAVTLAVGAAFLLEYMDDTIKTPADIQRTVSLPTLGAIARMEDELPGDLPIAVRTPRAPIVEPFRSFGLTAAVRPQRARHHHLRYGVGGVAAVQGSAGELRPMVEPEREERIPLGRHEPPAIRLLQTEEPGRLGLPPQPAAETIAKTRVGHRLTSQLRALDRP